MDNMDMLRLEVGSKLVEIEDLLKDWNLPTVTGVTLVARDPDNPTGLHVVLTNGGDAEIDGAIELLRASRNGHTDAAPVASATIHYCRECDCDVETLANDTGWGHPCPTTPGGRCESYLEPTVPAPADTTAAPGEALLHRYRAALMGMVTQHCDISASARDMELVTHDFLSANEQAFDLLEQDGLLQNVGQEEYQVRWDNLRARALRASDAN